ncbi:hypothetical protein J4558_22915 [Leptolyngbya sp. 15MV]|nr:hypothetical protein J4558_22915 [Leptolyngbya sp. 15MV]
MIERLLESGLPMRLAAWLTPRRGLVERAGLRYRPGPRGLLDLTLPARMDVATPLVVFIHGGGWRTGERADYVWLARALEVAAHLDQHRREALYVALVGVSAQVFLTGTDATTFGSLQGQAEGFQATVDGPVPLAGFSDSAL